MSRRKKPKSQARQPHVFTMRFLRAEFVFAQTLAREAGLSLADLLRIALGLRVTRPTGHEDAFTRQEFDEYLVKLLSRAGTRNLQEWVEAPESSQEVQMQLQEKAQAAAMRRGEILNAWLAQVGEARVAGTPPPPLPPELLVLVDAIRGGAVSAAGADGGGAG